MSVPTRTLNDPRGLMLSPLKSVLLTWKLASALTVITVSLWNLLGLPQEVAERIIDVLGMLFQIDLGLVLLCWIAILIDLFTGLLRARSEKQKIVSSKLRRTVYKFIEYGLFVMFCTAVTNEFAAMNTEDQPWIMTPILFITDQLGIGSAFFVIWTELVSIVNNVPRLKRFFTFLRSLARLSDALKDRARLDAESEAKDPDSD